jgi:hypothetical protein
MSDSQTNMPSGTPNVEHASMELVDRTAHVRPLAPSANGHTTTTGVEFFPFSEYVLPISCGMLLFSCIMRLLHGGEVGAWCAPLDWCLGASLMCIVGYAVYTRCKKIPKKMVCEKDETIRQLNLKIAALTSNKMITLPDFVLKYEVFTYLIFKDYSRTSCVNHRLQDLSENVLERKLVPLYVPEDCKTLKEAVRRVHEDDRLATIFLGQGEFVVEDGDGSNTLVIPSAMNILGRPGVPKEHIVVVGCIIFNEGIQGNCHLQHMTLRGAKNNGVAGLSSFTMEDVLVEQCGYGVSADGT